MTRPVDIRRDHYPRKGSDAALPERPGRSGDTPLAETLSRVSATGIGGFAPSALLGAPDGRGWVVADGLFGDDGMLDDLLGRVGRSYGTDDKAAAGTLFLRGYLWRFLVPSVAAFLIDRRLPDLGARNVALRFDEGGRPAGLAFVGPRFAAPKADPEVGSPWAESLDGEDAMLAWMGEGLAGDHLPGLISALRRCGTRRTERALGAAAADVVAEAFLWVGTQLGREDEGRAFAEGVPYVGTPGRGSAHYFAPEQGGSYPAVRVRGVCCFYYRAGNDPCLTCPRITDDERARRMVGS